MAKPSVIKSASKGARPAGMKPMSGSMMGSGKMPMKPQPTAQAGRGGKGVKKSAVRRKPPTKK